MTRRTRLVISGIHVLRVLVFWGTQEPLRGPRATMQHATPVTEAF